MPMGPLPLRERSHRWVPSVLSDVVHLRSGARMGGGRARWLEELAKRW